MHFTEIKKGKLILQALAKYGILNVKTLHQIIPDIKDPRNLRKSIQNLYRKGLVIKRYEYLNGGRFTHYQINQHPLARKYIGEYLNVEADYLLQKDLSLRYLFHEQQVCLLIDGLKRKYPDGILLKEHEIKDSPEVADHMAGLHTAECVIPDALFIYTNPVNNKKAFVAIEYERTLKAKERIRSKLLYYARMTDIDGVIYVSPHCDVLNHVRLIYVEHVMKGISRTKDYGFHFLLTSYDKKCSINSFNLLKSVDGKEYSLDYWMGIVTTAQWLNLRNDNFN